MLLANKSPITKDEVDLLVAKAKSKKDARGYDSMGLFNSFLFIIGGIIILLILALSIYYIFINLNNESVILSILQNVLSFIVGVVLCYAVSGLKK